jgi:hypothetical protein
MASQRCNVYNLQLGLSKSEIGWRAHYLLLSLYI